MSPRNRFRLYALLAIAGSIVVVAAMALVSWLPQPLTSVEVERIARAEVFARDPAFPTDAIAMNLSVKRRSRWGPPDSWEIYLKRPREPTGYLVVLHDRHRVQVGRAKNGPDNSMSGELSPIGPTLTPTVPGGK